MSALPNSRKQKKKKKKKFHDPTQQAEGRAARWVNEPVHERHPSLTVHTRRPFNAEPSNLALQEMYTPKGQHYRRTHAPVPLIDDTYRLKLCIEKASSKGDKEVVDHDIIKEYSLSQLSLDFNNSYKEISCTMMCTGNRRGEYNDYGQTAGLPWANGSISTAKWGGYSLKQVLNKCNIYYQDLLKKGYKFITFWGLEGYHISIPLSKAMDINGDVIIATKMNNDILPRDHGYPLRMIVPGFVGARAVKWLDKIIIQKNEVIGPHQTGIAYKQLGPNYKEFGGIPKKIIDSLPPIDIIPVTSAITAPDHETEWGINTSSKNKEVEIKGYAYSGGGRAIARVDISIDNGRTWNQANIIRAPNQGVRSYKAWAWSQWRYKVNINDIIKNIDKSTNELNIFCKAIDDQYNQQPDSVKNIWNIRGILNTSWPRCKVNVKMITQAML